MLAYFEQTRAAQARQQHVAEVLSRAEQALRSARESWSVLPHDVVEVGLWCRELEAMCLEILALLDEVRSPWRAHSFSPLPYSSSGRGHMTSPHPHSPGVA